MTTRRKILLPLLEAAIARNSFKLFQDSKPFRTTYRHKEE